MKPQSPDFQILSPEEARAFIRDYRKMDPVGQAEASKCCMVVEADFKLASDTDLLPPNMLFKGELQAKGSSMLEFNHHVHGFASFEGVSSLRELGPNSWFAKDLNLGGTSVVRLDASVLGKAHLGGSNVVEIGMASSIETLVAINSKLSHFDGTVMNRAYLEGCTDLVEIGPHASFAGSHFPEGGSGLDHTPISRFTADQLAFLRALETAEETAVLAIPGAVYWGRKADAPPIARHVGDALRMTALCCGPFVMLGELRQTEHGVELFPINDPPMSEKVFPYYKAALEYSRPGGGVSMPGDQGLAPTVSDGMVQPSR